MFDLWRCTAEGRVIREKAVDWKDGHFIDRPLARNESPVQKDSKS